jgi:acyl carrier protein
VPLDALPMTSTGKLDRGALPEPEWNVEGDRYVPPRTPTEALLTDIWTEVLELGSGNRAGVLDNFFDLGGHSLLATQVVARVRQAFGVELPMRAVFEAPTIAGLAVRVDALTQAAVEDWELEEELRKLEGLSDGEIQALLGAEPGEGGAA